MIAFTIAFRKFLARRRNTRGFKDELSNATVSAPTVIIITTKISVNYLIVSRYYKNWKIKENVNTNNVSNICRKFQLSMIEMNVRWILQDFLSSDIIFMSTNNAHNSKLKYARD